VRGRGQLCLSRQPLRCTALGTGCAPFLQCLGRLSLPPSVASNAQGNRSLLSRYVAGRAGEWNVSPATICWLSIYGVHIGANWRIRLNHPCVEVMRPYVKLL